MPNNKLSLIKDRAQKDYYFFCKQILGYGKMRPKPHQEMCDFLEPVLTGKHKVEGSRKKLLLEPRGSFKSSVSTVGGSLWALVQDPNIRILVAGETQKNAKKFVKEIKTHLETNPRFKAIFGDWVNDNNTWKDDEFIIKTRTAVKKESSVTAASLEKQSSTGQHYDLIFLDDPVSFNNINTPEQLQKTIDFYKMLLSILDPKGAIVVVGTRYSAMDLYGWLSDPESPEFGKIDVLCREAISDEGDLLFPEELTKEFLDEQKATQGPFLFACNPAEAPVLMSDWTVKPIAEVKPGDKVIGFEVGKNGKRTRLVETVVKETNSRIADVVKLTMHSGHSIRCTPDHNWYTGRRDKTHRPYQPARVGTVLKRVLDVSYKPTSEELLDWRYLAGMVDGEGACKHGTIIITQSQVKNPAVTNEIRDVLKRLHIDSKEYIYAAKSCHYFALNGGRDTKHRLLQWGKPAKKDQIVKVIMKHGNRLVGGERESGDRDKVKSITPDGQEMVYALTTGTGNYIAWGYASKNCQYLNRPVSSDTCVFTPETIKFYDKLPEGLIYFITLDPAISTKERSDYSALVVNGVDYHHNWFIKHALQVKLPPSELISLIFDLAWEVKDNLMCFAMEKFSLEQIIKVNLLAEMEKRKWAFPIKELPTDTRVSKENRIRALQPRFQNGQVFIHKDQKHLYHQLLYYPQGVKNDDLLDALKSQLQITFPSPHLIDKPKGIENPHLKPREREIWDQVRKLGTRKVIRKGFRI